MLKFKKLFSLSYLISNPYQQSAGGEIWNISAPRISYNSDEYCLQEIVPSFKKGSKASQKWKWKLKVCHKSEMDPKMYRFIGKTPFDALKVDLKVIFQSLAYLSSSLIIGIVLLLYRGYIDLQCTRGKCLIYLLWSHLSIFALLMVARVAEAFMYDIYLIIMADCTLFAFFCLILFFTFMGIHNVWRLW